MSDLIPVKLDNVEFFIEADRSYGSEETSAVEKVTERIEESFDHAQLVIMRLAERFVGSINNLKGTKPAELTVEFAIKFSAEGNVVVTKVGTEANFTITLTYKTDK